MLTPSEEAAVDLRLEDLRTVARPDGGFADARRLFDELTAAHVVGPRLAEAALLVTKGAFTVRDHEAARRFSRLAVDACAGDLAGANLALRFHAAALLHLRAWDEAFDALDTAFVAPGPLFGALSLGVGVSTPSTDPIEHALDEAQAVVSWATPADVEWVRVLGSLAVHFAGEPIGPVLQARFEAGLDRLESLEEFHALLAQLWERRLDRQAARAARLGVERHPEESWYHSVYAGIARDLGDHRAAYEHRLTAAQLLEAADDDEAADAWEKAAQAATTIGDTAAADAARARARALGWHQPA